MARRRFLAVQEAGRDILVRLGVDCAVGLHIAHSDVGHIEVCGFVVAVVVEHVDQDRRPHIVQREVLP